MRIRPGLGGTARLLLTWIGLSGPVFGASVSPQVLEAVEGGRRDAAARDASLDALSRLQLQARASERDWLAFIDTALPGQRLAGLVELSRRELAAGNAAASVRHAGALAEQSRGTALDTEAQFLLAQAEWLDGRYAAAEERFDWISRHGTGALRGWALLGQAEAALARSDTGEAIRLLKSVAGLERHEAAAPALLELGRIHDERGDGHQAVRYLTLYQEAFPHGILPVVEPTVTGSSRADVAAGVVYAVQVGVFGERSNAVRQKERFEAAGYTVRLVPRMVGDQRYTGVWVGRYRSRQDAQSARRSMESSFGETYRVVVAE